MWNAAVASLALTLFPANDDGYKPLTVRFEHSLDAAFERAKREKIPVMVCVLMDDESANDMILFGHYRDKRLGELTKHVACVIANAKTHGEMDEGEGAAAHKVCNRFGSITCAEHLAVEMESRKRWLPGDLTVAPQHLFFDPTGKEILRQAYFVELDKLQKMIQVARYIVDSTSVDRAEVERELKLAQDQYQNALSKNEGVRKPAIQALAAYEDPRAFKLLADLARKKDDDLIRTEAFAAISQKGSYRALPILLEVLKDKKVLIRNHAVVALERLALPDAAASLLKLYKAEPSERVQGSILRALAKCAPKNPEVVALILKESANKNYLVRLDDAVALGFLTQNDPKLLDVLRKMAESDENSNFRGVACWALGMHADRASADLLKKIAASDKVAEVRTAATASQKALDSADARMDIDSGYQAFVTDEVAR
ncbi:MAG: HEAT repeat domain-containing protein [Planctomycetes bacterium]|nr:HEAT repeat domain-containing protein [Planctomycetota bacterium]MBI3847716.1 HEAT repeat domain-containing protein [Planctomycetota bacterium]